VTTLKDSDCSLDRIQSTTFDLSEDLWNEMIKFISKKACLPLLFVCKKMNYLVKTQLLSDPHESQKILAYSFSNWIGTLTDLDQLKSILNWVNGNKLLHNANFLYKMAEHYDIHVLGNFIEHLKKNSTVIDRMFCPNIQKKIIRNIYARVPTIQHSTALDMLYSPADEYNRNVQMSETIKMSLVGLLKGNHFADFLSTQEKFCVQNDFDLHTIYKNIVKYTDNVMLIENFAKNHTLNSNIVDLFKITSKKVFKNVKINFMDHYLGSEIVITYNQHNRHFLKQIFDGFLFYFRNYWCKEILKRRNKKPLDWAIKNQKYFFKHKSSNDPFNPFSPEPEPIVEDMTKKLYTILFCVAAEIGSISHLDYVYNELNGGEFLTEEIYSGILKSNHPKDGHFAVLEWIHKNNLTKTPYIMAHVGANSKSTQIVEWFVGKKYPYDHTMYIASIKYKNLITLNYITENEMIQASNEHIIDAFGDNHSRYLENLRDNHCW